MYLAEEKKFKTVENKLFESGNKYIKGMLYPGCPCKIILQTDVLEEKSIN